MVREIEYLAKRFEQSNFNVAAVRLRRLSEDLAVDRHIPETLQSKLQPEDNVYHHSKFDYVRKQSALIRDGKTIILTHKENVAMALFTSRPNRIISNFDFLRAFQEAGLDRDVGFSPANNSARMRFVDSLRSKVGDEEEKIIVKVHGRGYLFVDPEKSAEQTELYREIPEGIYSHPDFIYYPERSMVKIYDREVTLTPFEASFLTVLTLTPNRAVGHDQIIQEVWGNKDYGKSNLNTLVSRFRKKLEPENAHGNYKYIQTVRGIGFRLYDPSKM